MTVNRNLLLVWYIGEGTVSRVRAYLCYLRSSLSTLRPATLTLAFHDPYPYLPVIEVCLPTSSLLLLPEIRQLKPSFPPSYPTTIFLRCL